MTDIDSEWSKDLSDQLNSGPVVGASVTVASKDKVVSTRYSRANQLRQKLANVQVMKQTMKIYQRQVSEKEIMEPCLREDVTVLMASLTEFEDVMKRLHMAKHGGNRKTVVRTFSGYHRINSNKDSGMVKRVRSTPTLRRTGTAVQP
ncbi:expressed unknown protein [Seminavis robusta]|uniref:Uncharacterized protein n=1 Tax=Seminavis robusta TaxID=568900 RepID=A0A9N8E3L2_9STRA|nr:expressed unknown protein [Seminavis robusta]|eukprot:Sro619_g176380.1 n/a (147) ;mRNA; f:10153-10593